jgi:NADH dehydrogenase
MALVLVTGASGFVGSSVVPALLDAGHEVRAFLHHERRRAALLDALPADQRARVGVVIGDVTRAETLAEPIRGADAVVHLVAIPRDRSGGRDLERVNTGGTVALLGAMRDAAVSRLVHVGALGVADDPALHYGRSKARAEVAVRASGLRWTVLRPSLMWGPGDGFFRIIGGLIRFSPGLVPVPARQRSRFQPLWVGDLARSVVLSLERDDTVGGTYELGGPELWTYPQIVREVAAALGKRRALLPLPLQLIKLVAGIAEMAHLPFPVATDQLRQLAFDNATDLHAVERDWGFPPRSMRGELGYLRRPGPTRWDGADVDGR